MRVTFAFFDLGASARTLPNGRVATSSEQRMGFIKPHPSVCRCRFAGHQRNDRLRTRPAVERRRPFSARARDNNSTDLPREPADRISGTESLQTLRWRELDSNFQFLDLGRAFFTR